MVPTDCLAARLAQALPDASLLELAFAGGGGFSRGTLKTMLLGAGEGGHRGGLAQLGGVVGERGLAEHVVGALVLDHDVGEVRSDGERQVGRPEADAEHVEQVLRVEDIEALVLHRAHREIMRGDDMEHVEVVAAAKAFLVPAHRRFQTLHRPAAAADRAGLGVDDKPHTAAYMAVTSVAFWITPFLLRLAGLWPETGTTASTIAIFAFFFLSNTFGVTVMISASSMIADIVEDEQVKTGRRTEGVFFAGNFFIQKCATGLGIFISGMIISWAGLSTQTAPDAVAVEVIDRLTTAYIALVAVLGTLSAMVFVRFPIRRHDHEARVRQLAAAASSKGD